MSLRTKLICSFLLLSVVPLTALVLYTYSSSLATMKEMAWEENNRLAGEISQRMGAVEQSFSRRMAGLSELPLATLLEGDSPPADRAALLAEISEALGEVAPFVAGFEFVPEAPAAPDESAALSAPGPPAPPGFAPPPPPPRPRVIVFNHELKEVGRAAAAMGIQGIELGIAVRKIVALSAEAGATGMKQVLPEVDKALAEAAAQWQTEAEEERREAEAERAALFENDPGCAITLDGRPIGHLRARVSAVELLQSVLTLTQRDRGEIPFALDREGSLYTADAQDLANLRPLRLVAGEGPENTPEDWAVAKVKDPRTGMTFGIARPLGESMLRLKRTALTNFLLGLGLVGLAVVGIVPLSRRITRGLSELSAGVEALAQGNLGARVPVSGRDEVARLATGFNHMAAELAEREQRLCEQERLAKENELERRVLAIDNERKSCELEEARSFQLSLLPKRLPEIAGLEIAVFMRTATEVGGDYYDFLVDEDGSLTVAVGDSTGHGAKAGTLVTAAKSLFVARACQARPSTFLAEANRAIKSMELSRMAMALTVARYERGRLTVASAGMPPVLVATAAEGHVQELAPAGLPLGSMSGATYEEESIELGPGDVVLLSSDGFAELLDGSGEPLGYPAVEALFAATRDSSAEAVIEKLATAVATRKGGAAPDDDVTFVVLKRLPA